MRLLDYECQTTFWEDFSIAEIFDKEAIRDTYRRARAEWERDRVYGTELLMIPSHKCRYRHKEQGARLSQFMLSYEKSTMIECLRIGRVKI